MLTKRPMHENTAQLIISGLPLLGATEMCTSSLIPFMCLYLFPLCDGNGTAHKPSRDQCIEISTVVYAKMSGRRQLSSLE